MVIRDRRFWLGRQRPRAMVRYFLPQVVSPMPEAHLRVPSENVEQKKPARQSESPEQVPHSSVEAHDVSAPMTKAAKRANARLGVIRGKRGNLKKKAGCRPGGFWQALMK